MWNESRLKPLETSPVFADGRSSRPLPADTVARGAAISGTPFETGMSGGRLVETIPLPVDRALIDRGQERYEIYCSPCHGYTGNGDGMIVQRGFSPPPSYHSERLRTAPAGHFYDVMTHGYGAMYSYSDRVTPQDRWAITAYIRVLQRSRNATLADVPPEVRGELERKTP